MPRPRSVALITALLIALAALPAVAGDRQGKEIEFVAPAGEHSGWSLALNAAVKIINEKGLAGAKASVINMPGDGGGVALTDMQRHIGKSERMMIFSPPLLYINLMGNTAFGYKELTPVGTIMHGCGAFAVRADAPWNTIGELLEALKADQSAARLGGTSIKGSMDHVQFLLAAKRGGVMDLDRISYTGFQDGDCIDRLLAGEIDVASTGPGDVLPAYKEGRIKVLAVTAVDRVGILPDVPTLIESGIDLNYVNWRGIFGPPEMPVEARDAAVDLLKRLTEDKDWIDVCHANGWDPEFTGPDEFSEFLGKAYAADRDILYELGMLSIQPLSEPEATAAPTFDVSSWPAKDFDCVAPAGEQSGWSLALNAAVKVLNEKGLAKTKFTVRNIPGEGGNAALTDMQRSIGDPYRLVIFSPPLLYINLTGGTAFGFRELTPVALIMRGHAAFAVPTDSPYKTINDLMDAIKADPKSVRIGGTSAKGSMDHVQFLLAAKAAGVPDLDKVVYESFAETGEINAMLEGKVDAVSTGPGELIKGEKDGTLRVLAVTAKERLEMLPNAPTLIESGIDTSYNNWRGIFGTPEMPKEALALTTDIFKRLNEVPEWKRVCAANGWTSEYMAPEEFSAFLDAENERAKALLYEIGLLSIQPLGQ